MKDAVSVLKSLLCACGERLPQGDRAMGLKIVGGKPFLGHTGPVWVVFPDAFVSSCGSMSLSRGALWQLGCQ